MRKAESRHWRAVGVAVMAAGLVACGSAVPPEEFVGALSAQGGTTATAVDGAAPVDAAAPEGPAAGADPAPGSDAGTTTGASGGGAPSGAAGAPGADASAGPVAAGPAGTKGADCTGFKNGPGVTDTEITIATVADVSGAVPNVFKSAHDAVTAYAAAFNSSSSICGRKLKVKTYDSALSASGDNEAAKAACSAFALVGSMSGFDSGGVETTNKCGQPDVRNSAVTKARQQSAVTHPASSLKTSSLFLQPWVYVKQKHPDVIKDSAFVYLNAGASGEICAAFMKGTKEKLGYDWKKIIVVDITSTPNWNAYVSQMKAEGIKFVQTNLGSFTPKLLSAMKQAEWNPVYMGDGSAYTQATIGSGDQAKAVEGKEFFTQAGMLEEAGRNPEMAKYLTWVDRIGGVADATGVFSWAAAELFTSTALKLGGKLSRQTLLAELKNVHDYTANGIMSPSDPGGRTTGKCVTIMRVQGGKFTRVTPYPYTCGPLA